MASRPGSSVQVRSAGGLLWRSSGRQRLVCLVHRRRYDDWSLPKGKLEPGEQPLVAAVREVAEETGFRAIPEFALPSSRYRVPEGTKHVDYWSMRATEQTASLPVDDFEVDQVRWLPAAEAASRLSYPRDLEMLRIWRATPPVTGLVLLVRHADAGTRVPDPAADHDRPLSRKGITQATSLCQVLALFAPERLVSAPPLRCVQTLQPLTVSRSALPPLMVAGRALPPLLVAGHRITLDPRFAERSADPAAAAAEIQRLGETGTRTVICSQAGILPSALATLAAPAADAVATNSEADRSAGWATAKGDGWLLPFSGPLLLGVSRLRPAP